MRSRAFQVIGVLVGLLSTVPAAACMPILPMAVAMAGALQLLQFGIPFLLAAIAIKCISFFCFERSIPWYKAVWLMFLANLLSTVIGAAAMFPATLPPAFFLIFGIAVVPAKRLAKVRSKATPPTDSAWPKFALGATVAYMVSMYLFLLKDEVLLEHWYKTYWLVKLLAVFTAVSLSMVLTTFWEEWAITSLLRRTTKIQDTPIMQSVISANVVTFLFIVGVPAALILPSRLESSNFIVLLRGFAQVLEIIKS